MINRKCAVIIGVNQTGQLPKLQGAVKGAEDFYAWADAKQFDTALITDKTETVTVRKIKDAIKEFTKEKTYDLMIIYFAGHGFLKSAYDEYWLLSDAPEDPNEAVNVLSSKSFARKCRVPHVVFISDACRSRPADAQISEVVGSSIFGNPGGRNEIDSTMNIDMLFATMPGDPAYEASIDEALPGYKGIYTEHLIKGLNGKVSGIQDTYMNGQTPIRVIYSNPLQDYLAEEVPKAAEKISIKVTQKPYAEITSRAPKFLVEVEPPQSVKELITPRRQSGGRIPSGRKGNRLSFTLTNAAKKYPKQAEPKASAEEISEMQGILKTEPEDFTGFVIKDLGAVPVLYGNIAGMEVRENQELVIRLSPITKNNTVLLALPGNRSVPLAVLPDFIGTVTIQDGIIIDINYHPSLKNRRFPQYQSAMQEVDARRAAIALGTRDGLFRTSNNIDQLISSASYFRNFKALDPMLGLYAAYAYAQAGAAERIQSVYEYMFREKEPVLFDVVMLNNLFSENKDIKERTASACPILNQGWSYLTGDKEQVSPELWEISRYREPGLWTTFNEKGTEKFIQYLEAQG